MVSIVIAILSAYAVGFGMGFLCCDRWYWSFPKEPPKNWVKKKIRRP